jgi:hypothetical protein
MSALPYVITRNPFPNHQPIGGAGGAAHDTEDQTVIRTQVPVLGLQDRSRNWIDLATPTASIV